MNNNLFFSLFLCLSSISLQAAQVKTDTKKKPISSLDQFRDAMRAMEMQSKQRASASSQSPSSTERYDRTQDKKNG